MVGLKGYDAVLVIFKAEGGFGILCLVGVDLLVGIDCNIVSIVLILEGQFDIGLWFLVETSQERRGKGRGRERMGGEGRQ